jgi:hypothetical protein
MSQLTAQELAKVRKLADESVTLKNEMKLSVIEDKLRTLNVSVKKLLIKKGTTLEIIVMKEIE